MPAPVPLPIRRAAWVRLSRGETVAEVAAAFGLAQRTVRDLRRRGRERGEAGLAPDPPRPRAGPAAHPAHAPAVLLRREHPGWGAGLIRVMLARQGVTPLPAVRTLQRWFAAAGLGPAPAGRRPAAEGRLRAAAPHDVWQVDAAEDVGLADGSRASWLRVADEFTGAVLGTAVFPPRAMECRPPGRDPGPATAALRPLGPAPHRAGR